MFIAAAPRDRTRTRTPTHAHAKRQRRRWIDIPYMLTPNTPNVTSDNIRHGGAMTTTVTTEKPQQDGKKSEPGMGWAGAFVDLPREHGFESMRVEGTLPADLRGTL